MSNTVDEERQYPVDAASGHLGSSPNSFIFSTKTVEKAVPGHRDKAVMVMFTAAFSDLHHAGAAECEIANDLDDSSGRIET